MNWQEFDPVKAIEDAQRKLDLLSSRNKEYLRFLGAGRIETVKSLVKKQDFGLSDLSDSGMIFVMHLTNIELEACINTLDFFVLGMDPDEAAEIISKLDQLKASFSKVRHRIERFEQIKAEEEDRVNAEALAEAKRKRSLEKFDNSEFSDKHDEEKELISIISDFIGSIPSDDEIVVPEQIKERYVPFDMRALEKKILKNEGLTVKQIGTGLKIAETPSLGIAVTFQACLHLDVAGKVVLKQGQDDVLVLANS